MNNIRILFWNCRGVPRRRLELFELLKNKNIDVLLLDEIHLSNKTLFKLPYFHLYIINRHQWKGKLPAGGTAIQIKWHLKMAGIHHQVTIKTISIENTLVHI